MCMCVVCSVLFRDIPILRREGIKEGDRNQRGYTTQIKK